jgi:hypothetical protein
MIDVAGHHRVQGHFGNVTAQLTPGRVPQASNIPFHSEQGSAHMGTKVAGERTQQTEGGQQ